MPTMIRVRNDGRIPQVFNLRGTSVRVVPGGTALIPEGNSALSIRSFTRIGTLEVGSTKPASADPNAALLAQLAALQAEIAQLRAAPSTSVDETYPQHLRGGKWRLSNGSETPGGLSALQAQELEAELH
jgi:hypothetical protein